MPPIAPIANISEVLKAKLFPTIMLWNRLEGRPRTHHFDRALKAEVRDALWMLTRQWQVGEFKADDAGSPVFAKLHVSTSKLQEYQAANHPEQPYEPNVPLEVKAEQKKIPFTRGGHEMHWDIRLQLGKYWLKLLEKNELDFGAAYINTYTFHLPPNDRSNAVIYAHPEHWKMLSAISGRTLDGFQLLEHLKVGLASDGIANTNPAMAKLDGLGNEFKSWYARQYYQPFEEGNNAWLPERMEYQFSASASNTKTTKALKAEEYYQGTLDWYAFDISEKPNRQEGPLPINFTNTIIPSHVEFDGMPNTRWWKFEDGKTNLGDIKPTTSDVSKLLLMEFALVFANDWFLIPHQLPIGSVANIEGLAVKNNFGETTWINAAQQPDQWSLFKLNSSKPNSTLFLPPVAMKVHESNPLEEIMLIRDEMSNMVWGIELATPTPMGTGDKGGEAAFRTRQFFERIVLKESLALEIVAYNNLIAAIPNLAIGPVGDKTPLEQVIINLINPLADRDALITQLSTRLNAFSKNFTAINDLLATDPATAKQQLIRTVRAFYEQIENILSQRFASEPDPSVYRPAARYLELHKNNSFAAPIHYLAMTSVPENWIPFVPVHVANDNRETQLQRASMLRIIDGDPLTTPVKVKPQTSILREGLDAFPDPQTYKVHEQEVLRVGTRVQQAFQRTRWINGEVFVWLGMKKKPGRGEGSSGLAFDQIKNSQ